MHLFIAIILTLLLIVFDELSIILALLFAAAAFIGKFVNKGAGGLIILIALVIATNDSTGIISLVGAIALFFMWINALNKKITGEKNEIY